MAEVSQLWHPLHSLLRLICSRLDYAKLKVEGPMNQSVADAMADVLPQILITITPRLMLLDVQIIEAVSPYVDDGGIVRVLERL